MAIICRTKPEHTRTSGYHSYFLTNFVQIYTRCGVAFQLQKPQKFAPQLQIYSCIGRHIRIIRAGLREHSGGSQFFVNWTNVYAHFYTQSNIYSLVGVNACESLKWQKHEQRTDLYAAFDYFFRCLSQG